MHVAINKGTGLLSDVKLVLGSAVLHKPLFDEICTYGLQVDGKKLHLDSTTRAIHPPHSVKMNTEMPHSGTNSKRRTGKLS
jgi:hypothetical protein